MAVQINSNSKDSTVLTNEKQEALPTIQSLRQAIPAHCFQPSTALSISYIARDLLLCAGLAFSASKIHLISDWQVRWLLWAVYGFVQGCVFTGIWILAHECGHGSLFKSSILNNCFGFSLHSFLLVPFFSWKYSHARHHRYTNNMERDTAFVPSREKDVRVQQLVESFFHLAEDTPALSAAILLGHQLLGWPMYILFCITSGKGSSPSTDKGTWRKSHLDPLATLWTSPQRFYIFLSDLGLSTTVLGLVMLAKLTSPATAALLYVPPYLWVNHWLVSITYLHHTHPNVAHFEDEAWTFQKGAFGTVDRDFGWIGKHIFHGIIEFHVIHHLFPRIPFYRAEEATESIRHLLGDRYIRETKSFCGALWKTFIQCKIWAFWLNKDTLRQEQMEVYSTYRFRQ